MNIKQLLRYGLIGLASTAIHLTVAFLLLGSFGAGLFLANMVGFLCAYVFSYLVQARFVFLAIISLKSAFRYFWVQFFALILSMQLSGWLESSGVYWQTLLVVLVIPVVTFFIHKLWTFPASVGKT
jgi:putative flippase GtrA